MDSSRKTNYFTIASIWLINIFLLGGIFLFIFPGNFTGIIFPNNIEMVPQDTPTIILENEDFSTESLITITYQTSESSPTNTKTPYLPEPVTLTSTPQPSLTPIIIHAEPTQIKEQPMVIGYSVQGRPLEVFVFGDGKVGRLVVAGIHGGSEGNTIQLATTLINDIELGNIVIPPDITLYILRSLNPDGEALGYTSYGRANTNNVDLNRNWGINWQPELDTTGCWNLLILSPGSEPYSEPETQSLKAFIENHPEIDALISYHSAYLGIFPGGIPPDTKSISLAEAISAISPYPYPPIDTGCSYTGQLIDWASSQGLAALDIELSDHISIDYDINKVIMDVFLNWQY